MKRQGSKADAAPACAKVGGQAVMEGVMMQGPARIALAVRAPGGKIVLRVRPLRKAAKKYPILGWPIIRGVVNFGAQMYVGVKMLAESAELAGGQAEAPSKLEQRVARILRMKPEDVMMLFALVLALVLSVGLFFALPVALEVLIKRLVTDRWALNLLGGLIRISVFLAYVGLVSRLKEIRRVFQYHGAEHKSIHCYEQGLPLTVENAQKFSTLHPRCGTSFLMIVLVISIFMFVLFGTDSTNVFARVGSRLALLPLVAGVSYEVLQWLGRAKENWFVRALKWPGMMTQKLTTKPPDDGMVEVALASLRAALDMPEEREPQAACAEAAAQ